MVEGQRAMDGGRGFMGLTRNTERTGEHIFFFPSEEDRRDGEDVEEECRAKPIFKPCFFLRIRLAGKISPRSGIHPPSHSFHLLYPVSAGDALPPLPLLSFSNPIHGSDSLLLAWSYLSPSYEYPISIWPTHQPTSTHDGDSIVVITDEP